MRNRQFVFAPKIQYEMAAERSEVASSDLPFSKVSPREESNLYYEIRNLASYPLNDEGIIGVRAGPHQELRKLSFYPLNYGGVFN